MRSETMGSSVQGIPAAPVGRVGIHRNPEHGAGIFTAGTVQRFRLWKISKLVWIPPAVWTAGGFLGVCRATRRLERSRLRRRT